MADLDAYGDPAAAFTAKHLVKRDGTHVAAIRFTYEYGPSHTQHQNEMVRLSDLNRLINELTAIAAEAGIR
ncbi:hypothetical protein GCM10010149_47810 [Nonomuraea roseoviolacea subsp. roseoviolacea]|uniref:hypothetical protein n=1 Tax=Nonomuraea roseoviolacea TaxID=103837 RepID=UPI0031D5D84D